ncbi:MAG: PLP-dependent aspartate aminotransferase family protein [Kiritimatiellaeota bacterium]|nr:PLP-dependent aspartate aminotransferase family protein [Kiritimatiellota bacterium]
MSSNSHDRPFSNDNDILTHLGDDYEMYLGAVVPPIFMNSLHVTPKSEIDSGRPRKFNYGRASNPTAALFEQKVAALEKAERALSFGSGMAAISSAILACVKAGDHIVCVDKAYGPTRTFITRELTEQFGVEATFIDGSDIGDFEAAVKPNTTLFYLESPTSGVFTMQDLRAVAALAKSRGIKTAIDNTWATPIYQKPLTMGIDLSIHTVSKYIGGHSDVIAGVVAGNEPLMARVQQIREYYGGILGPMEAWLATRGLRTLAVRLAAHEKAAGIIARRLEAHPKIKFVRYPGLESDPQHALARSQMTGFTGLLSFSLNCANAEAREFVKRTTWFNVGPSWGGFESMINLPWGEDSLVRIHVGLEDLETLWDDLAQSLDKIGK